MDESEIAANLLPPPPERIGPYRIEERLGVGGMGAVYRAFDERLERPVAVKQLLPELADDTRAWKRLRREAKTVARLNHPAIVQIYDILEHDTGEWIVMELVEGPTLSSMIESGSLELGPALDLIRQVAEGLAAAHAKGVVHRDLKTENVMVDAEGRAKILDFGLAKSLWRTGDKSLSIEGSIVGTGRSMSPEQALGDDVDHRSDLFSLGSLIYETVTGRPPFEGPSVFRVLAQICSDPHPPAREVDPEIPEALEALIDRLLEKDPARRPRDAGEVAAALEKIVSGLDETTAPRGARRFPPPEPPTDSVRSDPTLWMHPAESPRPRKKSTSGLHIRTLLRIAVSGPGRLTRSGDQALAVRHDRLVRDLLARSGGLEIDKLDDGFLLLFELPAEAVSFALAYQRELASWRGEAETRQAAGAVEAGVGIHLGEMFMTENLPADVSRGAQLLQVEGPSKVVVSRVAELAAGGRVLMTQMAYDLARRGMREEQSGEEPLAAGAGELEWVARGRYDFADMDEAQRIFEVGPLGIASSPPPADLETARRLPGRRGDVSPAEARRRGRRRGLWTVAVLVAAAVGGLWWLASSRQPEAPLGAPESGRRTSLAVLGFKNLSPRSETDWLSTALAELFSAELAAGGDLRLVAGESVARMKLELSLSVAESLAADTLRRIRRNLDADHVLVGSYLVLDGEEKTLRLNLHLQPTGGGETVVIPATGAESEMFGLVSRAAEGVRQKLSLGRISAGEAAAVKATLSSIPEANRLYSEGLTRLRAYDALGAAELLSAALAADPEYALAHGALSRAWSNLGHDKKARDSARRAFELAKDLPAASYLAIEGRYHEVTGAWDKAEDTYGVLRGFHPDDVEHALRLAEAQRRGGRARQALATSLSLRLLPAPAGDDPRVDLAETSARAALSDYEGAVAAAERAVEKGRANAAWILVAEARQRQWRSLRNLGRAQEARSALEEARRLFAEAGDRSRVAEITSGVALLLEDEGQLAEAEKLYRQALDLHREIGHRKGVAEGLNNLADLILNRGELAAARDLVSQAISAAREIGDPELEAKCLDTQVWVLLHLGDLAEAETQAREALAIFEEMEQRAGVGWGHYYLGQVAFYQGDLEAAAAEYAKVLDVGRETGSNHLSSYALHSLAEVSLARGDLEEAGRQAEESRAGASELTAPASGLLQSRLLLAAGDFSAAAAMARDVARDLQAEERRDDEAAATVVLVQALLASDELAAAREATGRVLTSARGSQNPWLRLSVEIVSARVTAAQGDSRAARGELERAVIEGERRGLTELVFEAGLALAEIEIAAGDATGHRRLEVLAADARARGFGLVARKADQKPN